MIMFLSECFHIPCNVNQRVQFMLRSLRIIYILFAEKFQLKIKHVFGFDTFIIFMVYFA